jgi:NAD(P)H-dependent FMN reductase
MIRVAIIVGGAPRGAGGQAVAKWLHGIAASRADVKFDVLDIDELVVQKPGIAAFDAYIFLTPAREGGIVGALRNAIGYLYCFWKHQARWTFGRRFAFRRDRGSNT